MCWLLTEFLIGDDTGEEACTLRLVEADALRAVGAASGGGDVLSCLCGRQGDDARDDRGERAPAPRCGVRDERRTDGSGSRGSAEGGGGGRSTGAGISMRFERYRAAGPIRLGDKGVVGVVIMVVVIGGKGGAPLECECECGSERRGEDGRAWR